MVLEWLKRHAWKACNRQNRFAGSNPVLSAGFKAPEVKPWEFLFSPQEKEQVQSFEVKPRGFSVLSAGMRKYFSCN